jgi:hypothetical protein
MLVPVLLFADKSRIYDSVTGIYENGDIETLDLPRPRILLSKKALYHYEILEVFLIGVDDLSEEGFAMRIVREGMSYPSAGIEEKIPFLREGNAYRAVYLPGWNQVEGRFEIEIFYQGKRLNTNAPIAFTLLRRPIPDIDPGLSIVDLEMNKSILGGSFFDTGGRKTDYLAILDWAQFMHADMLWILAGETTSFTKRKTNAPPWDPGPLENLALLKEAAPQYGIEIGAYIMSFFVPGKNGVPNRYTAGLGYDAENDRLYRSRHISLSCERRIDDMIELVRRFQEDPAIAYIGFDFIRTGRVDGYELAEQVIVDTGIPAPGQWETWDEDERIRWFARKIEVERDPLIVEKWRWWRAHRVAEIVREILTEAAVTKPVWVYTLGWNHGKEHGQDPVMFFDAGVTFDAVMLYEASQEQFSRLLTHWNDYISSDQGNVLIGSCVDYKLLDSDRLTPPAELYRRNSEAYRQVMRNGFAKGIFFHDIARAFWGRKGGYSFMDYAVAHMSSVYGLNKALNTPDLVVDVLHEHGGDGEIRGTIQCKNNSTAAIDEITIELLSPRPPATIIYHWDGMKDDVATSLNFPLSSSIRLEMLGTFEAVSIPFSIHNLGTEERAFLFRVAIENKHRYYVHEFIQSHKSHELLVQR